MKEHEDYELIALDNDEESWGVRITSGLFIETVIKFGTIRLNELQDNMSFNFEVYSSPDSTLTPENEDLQMYCTKLLESIIMDGIEEGTVELQQNNAS